MSTRLLIGAAGLTGAVILLGQMNVGAGTGSGASDDESTVAAAPGEFIATGIGPDVIVGNLPAIVHWASDATESAYSFGTTSCNIGDADLDWIDDPSNLHPVIGQNMFRLSADGRFEHIGQAWLKHGFCALQQDLAGCGNCPNTGGCLDHLEPNCSDPYSASRNGGQGGMGPKWQVDAHTGVFPMPWDNGEGTSGSYRRRLRVNNVDLAPAMNPGALYFIEGQYVTQDDSAAGNQNNNSSYRRATVNASFDVSLTGPTEMTRPGIQAWQDFDPSVTLVNAQVPNEGLFIVGYKITDNGDGTWAYEYAIYNMNSDRSARGFSIPVGDGLGLTNVDFHDVDYHSGEPWDGTDWPWSVGGGDLTWETDDYGVNQNANALRWGTLYNFRFTSDREPVAATARIDLFKPGSPTSVDVNVIGPDPTDPLITFDFPDGLPALISPAGDTVRVEIAEIVPGSLVPGSGTIHVDAGGGFVGTALTPLGGDLYEGSFGATPCGTEVSYYFSAETTDGGSRTSPVGAPGVSYSATSALAIVTNFDDDGETDPGWTVENVDLTDGAWDRGIPAGGGDRGDPAADQDGSGQCWLTDNVDGNSDVDGGPTRLISPAFDLSGAAIADITYARWFTNDDQDGDRLDVHLSDDDGSSWTLVESVPDTTGWQVVTVRIDDFVTLTSQVRIRFSATDNPSNSVTEAGIDAVSVMSVDCEDDPTPCPQDIDGDGIIGFLDLLDVLSNWGPCVGCPQDIDGDNNVGFLDLLDILSNWGPCP